MWTGAGEKEREGEGAEAGDREGEGADERARAGALKRYAER